MIIFLTIILVVLLYARYFEHRELFLRRYSNLYRIYIENIHNAGAQQYKQAFHTLQKNQLRIIKFLRESGQPDSSIPLVEPVGFGYIRTANTNLYNNLLLQREDVIPLVMGAFRIAIGAYQQKKKDCFNPFYWLEVIVKLPKVILNYLNVPTDNIIVKIVQIVYWIMAILFGIHKAKTINLLDIF